MKYFTREFCTGEADIIIQLPESRLDKLIGSQIWEQVECLIDKKPFKVMVKKAGPKLRRKEVNYREL